MQKNNLKNDQTYYQHEKKKTFMSLNVLSEYT